MNTLQRLFTSFTFLLVNLTIFSSGENFSQKVFINEFLASNVSTNADIIDFDDYSDWFELYNADTIDIDLSGYYLSDNSNQPKKWIVPSGCIIESGKTLLFWADGYDAGIGETYSPDDTPFNFITIQRYHTNFKLSSAGEEILLTDVEGNTIDKVEYGPQSSDVSMGRFPDGSDNWLFYGDPSPEKLNSSLGVSELVFTSEPELSVSAGRYNAPLEVEILHQSVDVELYYTTDGSRPNTASLLFKPGLPISINKTTPLRVRAYQPGKLPSKIVTESYLINETEFLSTFSITTFPETLFDQELGIYTNEIKGHDVPVTVEYFNSENETGFKVDAQLRISGQASFRYPQKPLTISVDDRFGYESIDYKVFEDRDIHSFQSLYFRNSGTTDNVHTHFRDAFQHSIVINEMDLDCQAYQPVSTFINGEYWGIYNLREKVNSDYIAAHHNIDPNNIDYLEYDFNPEPVVIEGDLNEYYSLLEFLDINDLISVDNYNYIKSKIDINEYINYQIAQIYCDNVNWPNTNIRWWREKVPSGKWRYVMLDLDFGFGNPDWSSDYSNNTIEYATEQSWSTLIFRKLLGNEEFKSEFIQRFATYLNTTFTVERVVGILDSLENQLEDEMVYHIERWKNAGPGYGGALPIQDINSWKNSVQVMRDFAIERTSYMKLHINNYFSLNGMETLSTKVNNPDHGSILITGITVPQNYSGDHFKGVPIKLRALPKPGYQFDKWIGLVDSTNDFVEFELFATTEITAVFKPTIENVLPEVISSNTTLTKFNSPYIATSSILVDSTSQVIIEEGVVIEIPHSADFIVKGSLIIEGTVDEPVIIKNHESSGAEKWGALIFKEASEKSVLKHLKLINASTGKHAINEVGSISSYKSDIELYNIKIEDSPFPIFVQYGKFKAANCDLHSSKTCDLINVKYADSASIENSTFRGNQSYDTDAIDLDGVGYGLVKGNRIYNFFGSNSDGIDLGETSKNVLVKDNLIYNCADKGISVGQASEVIVERNIIVNCAQGIGVKDFGSFAQVINNTFYGCAYGVASFEKNIGAGGGSMDLTNSVIINSKDSPYLLDDLSVLNISYSLCDEQTLPGTNNIKANPKLGNNFIPLSGSPLIDSGDPSSLLDSDGSICDIGAISSNSTLQQSIIINEISYAPASGENFEFIELFNQSESDIDLSNFSLYINDDLLFNFPDNTLISSKEYIVIVSDVNSFSNITSQIFEWGPINLPDNWGNISLRNDNIQVDLVTYSYSDFSKTSSASPFPIQLADPGSENLFTDNWKLSSSKSGTPGLSNKTIYKNRLMINEFQANNSSTISDEYGNYSDWIELYNASNEPVSIEGLYFTDNFAQTTKYRIPNTQNNETVLNPGEYLILWADAQPDLGILHLNFRLDSDEEDLALVSVFDADTTIIDSISFKDQQENFSYGRVSDGDSKWQEIPVPTPGFTNSLTDVFGKSILLINAIRLNADQIINAYNNKSFWGEYEIDFWDIYSTQPSSYPSTLPTPIGTGEITLDILLDYRTIIWVSNNSSVDNNIWYSSLIHEYILNGGNVLLLTSFASNYIDYNFQSIFGISWLTEGSTRIYNCTSIYDGLLDMPLTGIQFFNSVFDSLITNKNTEVLFQDQSGNHKNIGFLFNPEYGGRYRQHGGNFVLIGGIPYRYENQIVKENIEFILKNFFHEEKPVNVEESLIITEFGITQNYPNPFNPSTIIEYKVKERSKVRILIYNILGEVVTELVNQIQDMGFYKTEFNADGFSSGVYFYEARFEALNGGDDFRKIRKMLLLK
jgi:parallel beta-helix repeat protein